MFDVLLYILGSVHCKRNRKRGSLQQNIQVCIWIGCLSFTCVNKRWTFCTQWKGLFIFNPCDPTFLRLLLHQRDRPKKDQLFHTGKCRSRQQFTLQVVTLAWISRKLQVSSNLGADGSGRIEDFSGSVTIGGHVLTFQGVQVYDASDASVIEVFFYVTRVRTSFKCKLGEISTGTTHIYALRAGKYQYIKIWKNGQNLKVQDFSFLVLPFWAALAAEQSCDHVAVTSVHGTFSAIFLSTQNVTGLEFSFFSPIRDRGRLRSEASLEGTIEDVVFGYTLLSTWVFFTKIFCSIMRTRHRNRIKVVEFSGCFSKIYEL